MAQKAFHHVSPEGLLSPVPDLAAAKAALKAGGYLWLDFEDPTREDLEPLVAGLGVHPLAVGDCLDDAQIPKLDLYEGSSFLLLNSYACAAEKLKVGEIDLILGKDFLVTVSSRGPAAHPLRQHIATLAGFDRENVRKGADRLLCLVVGHIVDDKYTAIDALQGQLDKAEDTILKGKPGFQLTRLIRHRRTLLDLRKSLFYEREVLVKVCRRDSPFISEGAVYYLRDAYDHLTKYYEEVEILREMLMGLMEMHLSIVNNRMSFTANRTNNSVRRLTYISVIFLPLMFLSGVGGMSEYSMMTGAQNWKVSYPAFLAVMAVIGAVMYVVVRWLDRKGLADEETGEG